MKKEKGNKHFLYTFYFLGTMLIAFILPYLIFQTPSWVDVIIPILQMSKLRHSKFKAAQL